MIQTLLRNAFGVGAQYRYERTEYRWGSVQFYLSLKDEALICPQCGRVDEVIRKGRRYRSLQTVPIGLKAVYLVTEVARCRCQTCEWIFEVHPPLPGRRCAIRASLKS
jgi:transposase